MNRKTRSGGSLDDRLKAALPDDLPSEVEAGMRARIAEFRSSIREAEEDRAPLIRLSLRGAWAALAVLMLILGSLLQGFRARTPLADGISRIKIQASNEEPGRSAPPHPTERPAVVHDEKETRS